jgi:hypothetical protein
MARDGQNNEGRSTLDLDPRAPAEPGQLSLAMEASVSLEAEVPEELFEGMRAFIRAHPHWDQYSVIRSALASFLVQNGDQSQVVIRHHLNGLVQRS